jgi:serine/threonine-protein kinase NIM1
LDKNRIKSLKSEVNILRDLSHPNIMKMYDSVDTGTKIHLIMEYVQGKSLYQAIRKKKAFAFSEKEGKEIFRQIAKAVCYMH